MTRTSVRAFATSTLSLALVVAWHDGVVAQEASKPDPFTLPDGYANARTATEPAKPEPSAEPGELRSYATLHSLGFEWDITGDTDHDATCPLAYRRTDETTWHDALPLFRVDYAGWYADRNADRPYNMLAGSILFLRPGTEYLVRLTLSDPDGGKDQRELTLRTSRVPDYGTPARTLHVVPRKAGDAAPGGDGSAERPLRGLDEAQKLAQSGDLFLLHAGEYGEATLHRSGDPAAGDLVGAQPRFVVWKGAGDGPAAFTRINLNASSVWLEGLTFLRAGEQGTGLKATGGASDVVIRANTFRGYSYSVLLANDSRRWYVADNDIVGDATTSISGEGVELNKSSDHTVCYNRISKTADGVSYPKRNCDIFANDVFDVSDDGVEPDYGYANIRIWGNRLNAPAGITFQPMYCGPWYIVRNQVTSSTNVFKLRVQDRYLVANNTFVGYGPNAGAKVPHAHGLLTATARNNLWIHGGGSPFLWAVQAPTNDPNRAYLRKYVLFAALKADWRTDVDYDGFDWSAADRGKQKSPTPFVWNGARIADLSALFAGVGIERHGRMVDKHKIFDEYVAPPYPSDTQPTFTLRPDGDAVDAGVPLANVSDEFSGNAPDLGAFEAGGPPPQFGPRAGNGWRSRHDDWVLRHQRGRP